MTGKKLYTCGLCLLLAACSGRTEVIRKGTEPVSKPVPDTAKVQARTGFYPDSAAVAAAFTLLSEQPSFKSKTEEDGASLYVPELPPLIGDVNRDGLPDALKAFTIEGRGGGNNWTLHYAVFINKEEKLRFSTIFNRGGDWAERIVTFDTIRDNVLYGQEIPNNNFPGLDTIEVQYVYKDNDLVRISK